MSQGPAKRRRKQAQLKNGRKLTRAERYDKYKAKQKR